MNVGLTIVWCISTALLFLNIFFAKRADPAAFERERRISLGWLYVYGIVGFIVNVLAVFFIFIGSWYPPRPGAEGPESSGGNGERRRSLVESPPSLALRGY